MTIDEMRDAAAQWQRRPSARARLAELSQRFRAMLERDGLGAASLQTVRKTYGDESAQSLMADFISYADRMDGGGDPVEFAERCGQLLAMLRERHGIDPDADRSRLDLIAKARGAIRTGRNAHAKAYGTPEERAARDLKLAKEFDYCFEKCGSKEKAYRAVARANNRSDRLVREAVKRNKQT